MSQKIPQYDLSNIPDPKDFQRFSSQVISALQTEVNGNLKFDENMKTQTVKVTFSTANKDQGIGHNLNKTGVNYLVSKKSASCDIFDGVSTSTNTTVYLQSSVAGVTVYLILF